MREQKLELQMQTIHKRFTHFLFYLQNKNFQLFR